MDRSEESFQNGPWRARPAGGTPKASRRSWAGRSDTGAKEAAVHRLSGVDVAAVLAALDELERARENPG